MQMPILEDFLEFERKNKLFELEYNGVYYWHLIRFSIYTEILYRDEASSTHPDMYNHSYKDKIGFLPYAILQFKQLFASEKCDFLFSYAYIRKEVNGEMMNPFTQLIQDDCLFSYKNYTTFNSNWTKEARVGCNNALLELIWMPIWVGLKMQNVFSTDKFREIEELFNLLNNKFNCNLSNQKYIFMIQKMITKFALAKKYFKCLIQHKFKAIITGCHYDLYHYALVAAARECGIPTIELQHGVIGRLHVSYNFFETSKQGKYFPDFLFTFGDYWSETARLPCYVKPVSVGFPLMDYSKTKLKDSVKERKQVLFISDGTIGTLMSKLAMRFSDLVVPQGYKVLYKFHPSEKNTWRARYPWLALTTNIETIDAPINVHELLATTQHVVGVSSTVLFEALAFGCNVYLWNEYSVEYLDDFIKLGVTPVFKDEIQLLHLISHSEVDSDTFISDHLFRPNSLKNIENALAEILQKEQNESDSLQV